MKLFHVEGTLVWGSLVTTTKNNRCILSGIVFLTDHLTKPGKPPSQTTNSSQNTPVRCKTIEK